MLFSTNNVISLYSAVLIASGAAGMQLDHVAHPRALFGGTKVRRQADPTCLANGALATGSALTGQEAGTEGIKAGQEASAKDDANFINFCDGQTITNGKQNTAGSCNPIPMGKIPSRDNMITALITNPKFGDQVPAGQTFQLTVQTQHLNAGHFTNPTTTYYSAPQDLDGAGDVLGHLHFTVQDLGGVIDGATPPDPKVFSFFKGVDDNGNGQGQLQASVEGGLQAGFYRVCTIISAANHQAVSMPVAQRGAQDDCIRFEVVGGGGDENENSNEGGNDGDEEMGEVVSSTAVEPPAGEPTDAPDNGDGNGDNEGGDAATTTSDAAATATSDAAASTDTAAPTDAPENGNEDGNDGGDNGDAASSSASAAAPTPTPTAPPTNGAPPTTPEVPVVDSGDLGGPPPPVTGTGDPKRPFSCNGNTFVRAEAAVQRACDVQFNRCADAANSGRLGRGGRRGGARKTVADCEAQKKSCGAK